MKENFQCCVQNQHQSITLYWERPQEDLELQEIFLKSADQAEADFTLIGGTQKDALHNRKFTGKYSV